MENTDTNSCGCCCGGNCGPVKQTENRHFLKGSVTIGSRTLPRVAASLSAADIIGTIKVRLGIWRASYRVSPGLYAVGNPHESSPVFASANYKLSFDTLRKNLAGVDCFILVLDTKGINVWCAAGKGTFGTGELAGRIKSEGLSEVVGHREVIVPQLGAPGIAAHAVKKETGFRVRYGPVRANDLKEYLSAGMKATESMRRVRFGFLDRLLLAPVEMKGALLPGIVIFLVLSGVSLASGGWVPGMGVLARAWSSFVPFLVALIVGAVGVPVLLPFIPGRAFAWKGWLAGMVWASVYYLLISPGLPFFLMLSGFLLLPALSSFIAMNFTGASTYTSLSGVAREMMIAVPAQIVLALGGLVFFVLAEIVPLFAPEVPL